MNLLSKVGLWLYRSNTANPEQWFIDWMNGGEGAKSAAGIQVGPGSAQRSPAVSACLAVRGQDIAKLPLPLYRKRADGRGRDRATDHPLYNLIGLRPNSRQTSFEWREMMQAHLDLWGNCYSRIIRDSRFRPVELIPLHPDWVTPKRSPDGTPFYELRMWGGGETKILKAHEMLHIRDRSDDGYVGKSIISRAKDVIGFDIAAAEHASKLFSNGAMPGVILSHPGKIGAPARTNIETQFVKKFGGSKNAYKVMVAAEGMEIKSVAHTNEAAQFIEARKLARAEIASEFRVPAHKIGIMDNATFSNIEHQSLEYVTDTLMPIARRWEQALNVALLRESEMGEYYFEFLFDALLRGDFLTQMSGFATGRQWGWFSADDVREKMNMNPLPDGQGDEYLRPSNMTLAGSPIPDPNKVPAASPAQPGKNYDDVGDAKVVRLNA